MREPAVVMFPIADVIVDRDVRQRGNVLKGIEQLAASMEQDGQLHPITIHEDGKLVAGERRLEAAKSLGWQQIRAQIFERLSYQDAYRIELQENIARRNLPWQEECRAEANYHQMKMKIACGAWTLMATANDLGVSKSAAGRYVAVGKHLGVDGEMDQDVVDCHSLEGAMNLIKGRAERATAAAASRGMSIAATAAQPKIDKNLSKEAKGAALLSMFKTEPAEPTDEGDDDLAIISAGNIAAESLKHYEQQQASALAQPIITGSFVEWIETYEGPAFDVLHVDFPWGKGYAGSNTRRTGKAHVAPTYADSEDVHWELLEALLTWQDKLALPVSHMIYWFDHEFYQPIKDTITNAGWKLVQPHPLIWHKPYQGVAADTKRRPRHTYEAAFLFSRGDRKLVKLDQDVFVGRKEENLHINQKSHEMLLQFLGMLVDENTAVFDPTCGSGSALAAARALGSPRVLGVEIDEGNADVARGLLQREG
jgi:ParB family chromosome partitioning protein